MPKNTPVRTPQRLVGIPEAQHRLGDVTRKYIYDLIQRLGQLPSCRGGRRRRIVESGLDAFIDDRIAEEGRSA